MVKKVQPRSAIHHERSGSQRQRLKIGLILECGPNGPDQKVCVYLINRLQPDIDVVSRTLREKRSLIANCGETAALLLQDNCQRVVIVWDSHPPWRLENPKAEEPCRHEEREGIFTSLRKAGVDSP